MSKYGGQTLAAMELTAQELKFHSLVKTRVARRGKSEPVFEEN